MTTVRLGVLCLVAFEDTELAIPNLARGNTTRELGLAPGDIVAISSPAGAHRAAPSSTPTATSTSSRALRPCPSGANATRPATA